MEWIPSNAEDALALTPQKLNALLNWLNSDRDAAAREYLAIQRGLIALFAAKGFCDAEDLADEAINRVADRLSEIGPSYEGSPARYFRGVARNMIFECCRRKEIATDRIPESSSVKEIDVSDEYNCLQRCLRFSKAEHRDFILDYHVYQGPDKIINHEVMAEELNLSINALRVKAFRLRARLEKCVLECVEKLKKKRKSVAGH